MIILLRPFNIVYVIYIVIIIVYLNDDQINMQFGTLWKDNVCLRRLNYVSNIIAVFTKFDSSECFAVLNKHIYLRSYYDYVVDTSVEVEGIICPVASVAALKCFIRCVYYWNRSPYII